MQFECKPFAALTPTQLYAVLQLRAQVFVVEQDCVYLDLDNNDQQASHLLGYDAEHGLAAYARLLPVGLAYPDHAAIGRVVTRANVRGQGAGKALLRAALLQAHALYGEVPLKLSAQEHLRNFYQGFGFEPVGNGYLEDGIPHIAMVRAAASSATGP